MNTKEQKNNIDVNNEHTCNSTTETYHIYDYLKANLGVFAGIGVTLMAALSALIGFCGYLYECEILGYWNVDLAYIGSPDSNRIYETIIGLTFIMALFLLFIIIVMIVEKSSLTKKDVLYLRYVKKLNKKERKALKSCKDKQAVSKSLSKNALSIEKLENEVKSQCKRMRKEVIPYLLLLKIILTVSFFVWLRIGTESQFGSFWAPIIASLIMSFFLTVIAYSTISFRSVNKKEIKSVAKTNYDNLEINTTTTNVSFPLKEILSGDYCCRQPDKKLKQAFPRLILMMALILVVLFVSFRWFGYRKAADQKQFCIVQQNEDMYAIVHRTGDLTIIAKCKEGDNNTLTIDTNQQEVIVTAGLEYKVENYSVIIKDSVQ